MYQGSFKGGLRKIEGCSESPLRVIPGSLKVSKRSSISTAMHVEAFAALLTTLLSQLVETIQLSLTQ